MRQADQVRDIPFGRPWITEEDRQAVMEVLQGPILTHGPQGKAFEAEFAEFMGEDVHCLTVSSCMAALHLAYLHFGIGPGDDVIVPAQTHTATAHAVEWVGATPVFVDCEPATANVTAKSVAAAVTPRTKAISVVHFVGIPCDMPGIMRVAEHHGLKVIEDCALALGARWQGKHVGLFGDAGCFSFYPVKHITTGEGGMFITRHEGVARGVRELRAFGIDRTHTERSLPGMYDVPVLGLNYRMSELQAALGRNQLSRIGEILGKRKSNFETLRARMNELERVHVLDAAEGDAQSSHYCLTLVLEGELRSRRSEIQGRLREAGVGTSIYYPHPVPRMTYYREKYGYDSAGYPYASEISDGSVSFPVGPHVHEKDVSYMADVIRQVLGKDTP